jgi:hypothetical protein
MTIVGKIIEALNNLPEMHPLKISHFEIGDDGLYYGLSEEGLMVTTRENLLALAKEIHE